jgi:hypothetical protein
MRRRSVPGDETETAEASGSKFDPGAREDIETIAARRARHAQAERKARRTPLQRLLSLPMMIVALAVIMLGVLQWRANGGAVFSANRLAVLAAGDAGQSARAGLPGGQEQKRISTTVSWCWWSKA